MTIKERIEAFVKLGDHIRQINEVQLNELQSKARAANNWFTADAVATALKGIEINLHRDKLDRWLAKYSIRDQYKTVAVVMAGNVPAVGFHDLLCILLSGNVLMAKLSSKDTPIIEFFDPLTAGTGPGITRPHHTERPAQRYGRGHCYR